MSNEMITIQFSANELGVQLLFDTRYYDSLIISFELGKESTYKILHFKWECVRSEEGKTRKLHHN